MYNTEKKSIFMPRLTEQEQQEIIRYLEADKPLPDKFRFLLFEGKREVELKAEIRRELEVLRKGDDR